MKYIPGFCLMRNTGGSYWKRCYMESTEVMRDGFPRTVLETLDKELALKNKLRLEKENPGNKYAVMEIN